MKAKVFGMWRSMNCKAMGVSLVMCLSITLSQHLAGVVVEKVTVV